MSNELEEIKRLLDAFEGSDWKSIHVRVGDLDVSISTDADATHHLPPAPVATAAAAPAFAPAPGAAAPPAHQDPPPAGDPALATPTQVESTAVHTGTAILAPSPGIFWRSPSPGAPPFIEVGAKVDNDTTVCIVELMKLMNNVQAGVEGTVTAILVANGEAVEMGQPIILVQES